MLIQACRDEYLSQETQNREFSLKAIGIVAFSTTVFGAVITFADKEKMDWISWFFLLLTFSFLAGTILNAKQVVIPKGWKRPLKINKVLGKAQKDTGLSIGVGIGKAYANAIETNWTILDPKARFLKDLICCATAQIISSASFIFYLFSR